MSGSQVDVSPTSTSAPVLDWESAITRRAGSATPVFHPSSDNPSSIEQPPGGASLDELDKEIVADKQHSRELRGKYAEKAYQLAMGCLHFWGLMLMVQGIIKIITGEEMWSDKVLIAVTTGVTVSVLAAFLGVIRGLFSDAAMNGQGKSKTKRTPE